MRAAAVVLTAAVAVLTATMFTQAAAPAAAGAGPYKVLQKAPVGGAGGFDYCFADADGRKLYIPRGNRVEVYDLDTLKSAGTITPTNGVHGAAVDPVAKHGFCSSKPVVMWDSDTLKTIKTIDVQGGPDGILFDSFSQHVLILSHSAPNVTVIDTKDGSITGTIDLGGAPEQGQSDGKGHIYITVEDKANVAVVDAKTWKVTAHYDTTGKAGTLAGLALDVKNNLIFVTGRNPAACAVMDAADGKILATIPVPTGVDASAFNPNTMEAFISTGNGKLTIIKESDPKTFAIEQTVDTLQGGKTCTLDTKSGNVYVIANDPSIPVPGAASAPAPAPASAPAAAPGGRAPRGGGGGRGGTFSVVVVGKETK